ncbi:MAG: hypothetical protein EAZ81_08365 [Verrucomicrobia bacterium]|nr:MAG: hypothetical protein EAZ81_08365 [Verrucomicrobiota bacterium]
MAAGEEGSGASALKVRVANFRKGPAWNMPTINPNQAENYVWHFASVSGTTAKGQTGPRWTKDGAVPPQSTFTLQLSWTRAVTPAQKILFDESLHAFLALGTIGLRATRGLGAFVCVAAKPLELQIPLLREKGIVIRERTEPSTFRDYLSALKDYSAWFRYDFRKKWKAERPSPLGTSTPRQASALRFRPIKLPDGQFTWLAYEVPHSRVLGPAARATANTPLLDDYTFDGSPPTPSLHKKGY